MRVSQISLGDWTLPLVEVEVAVVGSGCAGLNAADWLHDLGVTDVGIFTEGVHMGTSRNAGSDKQTYYKLGIAGGEADSVADMAQDYFDGQGMHGDIALVEAACSLKCFMKLVNLGVPFPTNRYGEYVGYKTDHDPRQRATSAGPLTSRYMTQRLEAAARQKGIPIFGTWQVVDLLVEEGRALGFLAADRARPGVNGLCAVSCAALVLATGGPANIYRDSAYPPSHTGGSAIALRAGARACNLQEWQYGLASVGFRWNLSGTYQQALPRYISVDERGAARAFLPDYCGGAAAALNRVFLKGYQWPFDARKVGGSSMVDLAVYHQRQVLGRKVYMDFRVNAEGMDALGPEAAAYLEASGAIGGTPYGRLAAMNPPAVAVFGRHGTDLAAAPLEVAVCAQHNNGGIAIDDNWRSDILGLYVVGEAACSLGVYRPGGSALNAAQVGGMRAAEHIASSRRALAGPSFEGLFRRAFGPLVARLARICDRAGQDHRPNQQDLQRRMSLCAAFVRDVEAMRVLKRDVEAGIRRFDDLACAPARLPDLLKYRDMLYAQRAVLAAMIHAAQHVGSRGSALVASADAQPWAGRGIMPGRDENLLLYTDKHLSCTLKPPRPIPQAPRWFESVWADYRQRKGL